MVSGQPLPESSVKIAILKIADASPLSLNQFPISVISICPSPDGVVNLYAHCQSAPIPTCASPYRTEGDDGRKPCTGARVVVVLVEVEELVLVDELVDVDVLVEVEELVLVEVELVLVLELVLVEVEELVLVDEVLVLELVLVEVEELVLVEVVVKPDVVS
jgi:hypothetical protein